MNTKTHYRNSLFYLNEAKADLSNVLRCLDSHPQSDTREEQAIRGCIATLGLIAPIYEKASKEVRP